MIMDKTVDSRKSGERGNDTEQKIKQMRQHEYTKKMYIGHLYATRIHTLLLTHTLIATKTEIGLLSIASYIYI